VFLNWRERGLLPRHKNPSALLAFGASIFGLLDLTTEGPELTVDLGPPQSLAMPLALIYSGKWLPYYNSFTHIFYLLLCLSEMKMCLGVFLSTCWNLSLKHTYIYYNINIRILLIIMMIIKQS